MRMRIRTNIKGVQESQTYKYVVFSCVVSLSLYEDVKIITISVYIRNATSL